MSDLNKMVTLQEEAKAQDTLPARLTELANINDELAEIVASNVSAPPELLKELASRDRNAIKKAVVSNPNTPTETLFALGEYFPSELLDNPIFSLLALENPNFVEEIPYYTLSALVEQKKAPRFLLKYAANYFCYRDRKIKELAELHVNLSREIREGWHEVANDKMSDFLFWDLIDRGEVQLLSHFVNFLPNQIFKAPHLLEKIAGNKNTPVEIIEKLVMSENDYIEKFDYLLVSNPNTPTYILEQFINCSIDIRDASSSKIKRIKMRNWTTYPKVAKHHNTSIKVLEKLSTDEDTDVRTGVAQNKNAPTNILIKLAEDDCDIVQSHVARNINTPINILNKLATSNLKYVRRSVARNKNIQKISSDILEKLIHDELPVVASLANNNNLPSDILNRLATNKNPEVRQSVATNQNTPIVTLRKLANDPKEKVRLVVARNPNCPQDILERYTSEQYNLLPINVVRRPHTSSKILDELAFSQDVKVRLNVAKHPNTSVSTLEKLASDRNIEVLEAVLDNPKCNLEIKTKIFTNLGKQQKPCLCRLTVFLTDYAESEDLAANYNSVSWLERYAIAQNKKTPKDTLEMLAKDCNRIVRATAKESLGNTLI